MTAELADDDALKPWPTETPQIRDNKEQLARYETLDNGKPVDETEWDMVRPWLSCCCLRGHEGFILRVLRTCVSRVSPRSQVQSLRCSQGRCHASIPLVICR